MGTLTLLILPAPSLVPAPGGRGRGRMARGEVGFVRVRLGADAPSFTMTPLTGLRRLLVHPFRSARRRVLLPNQLVVWMRNAEWTCARIRDMTGERSSFAVKASMR